MFAASNRHSSRCRPVCSTLVVAAATLTAVSLLSLQAGDAGARTAGVSGPLARQGDADLPADAFQRAAVKALRGDYGPLASWQRAAYSTGLQLGLTACWPLILTQYNQAEGRSGRVDRYGRPCDRYTAASNLIPPAYVIWTPQSGLRRVRDCGARRNDVVAAHRGGIWVDVWFTDAAAARRAGIDGWVLTRGVVIPAR